MSPFHFCILLSTSFTSSFKTRDPVSKWVFTCQWGWYLWPFHSAVAVWSSVIDEPISLMLSNGNLSSLLIHCHLTPSHSTPPSISWILIYDWSSVLTRWETSTEGVSLSSSLSLPVLGARLYWQLSSGIWELRAADKRLKGVEVHSRAGGWGSDDTVGITRDELRREKQPQSRVQGCV